ncbi:hypothetical protein AAIR98_001435 [Elusimicrobium simillimum]|uniref:hypothetical protein n=1 Tax=Elusimicrobium simillimum TaxID=3143438 RepID=UPI003C6EC553
MSEHLKLSICNRALSYAEEPPISSLSDNSLRAEVCARFWESSCVDLLQESDWGFARVIVKLTRVDVGMYKVDGYENYYELPPNTVSVQEVFTGPANLRRSPDYNGHSELNPEILFIPSLGKLVIPSNINEASAVTTYKQTDPAFFRNGYDTALAYYMSSEFSAELKKKADLTARLKQEAMLRIDKARLNSKKESKPVVIKSNEILDSRG